MLMHHCAPRSMRFSKVLLSSCKNSFCNPYYVSVVAAPQPRRNFCIFSNNRSYTSFSVMSGDDPSSVPGADASMHLDHRRSYEVVVAATRDMGIGKDGKLPWRLPSDLKFFKELTLTTSNPEKKNAVVMGRKTWESIPFNYRPLSGRLNVVLTRSGSCKFTTAEDVVVCGSIPSALELLEEAPYSFSIEKVFLIGGGQILRETINAPGCDAIHITEIETSFECDTFIPVIDFSMFHPWYSSLPIVENNVRYSFVTYVRVKNSENDTPFKSASAKLNGNLSSNKFEVKNFTFLPKIIFKKHDEYVYLRLAEEIISSGTLKNDRTGTSALSKVGCRMQYNLRKSFPLLTTKRVLWRGVVEELLWFISGSTNAKERGIHIWDGDASRDYLDSRYSDMHADYTGQGFDQLADVIDKIKSRPDDRHIIISAGNPPDLKSMALSPCPMFAQFYVANGELSCQMYQHSADVGLGVPFNIASYALLTCMIAHVCNLVPGDLIHVIGDAFVYTTHIEPIQKQLQKLPRPFPILRINSQKKDINSFQASDFQFIGYDPQEEI